MMSLFSDKIVKVICWTLLHSLWQGLLLALLTGLVMILSKKSSSALRYNLLSGIFVLFVAVAGFTFFTEWNRISAGHPLAPPAHQGQMQITKDFSDGQLAEATNNYTLQHAISRFLEYFNEHASLIVTIWFIVFMAKLLSILSGLVQVQRIRHYRTHEAPEFWRNRVHELAAKIRISKRIRLLESAIVKVPMVVGFLKPTILVPLGLMTNLSPAEVESILLHELAHIHRRDYFFNLLQCFVDIVFFFNPAILWISSLIRNEREHCCDDIAIRESKNKKQFVQALVSFHQYNMKGMKYAMPFAGRRNSLLNRVKRIVQDNNNTLNYSEKSVLLICLVVCGLAFAGFRRQQPVAKKPVTREIVAPVSIQKHDRIPQKKTIPKNSVKIIADPVVQEQAAEPGQEASEDKTDDLVKLEVSKNKSVNIINVDVRTMIKSALHAASDQLIREAKENAIAMAPAQKEGLEEFIQSLVDLGYKDISTRQAGILQDHGVDAGFILGFKEKGFGLVPLGQAQKLKDHDVDIEFLDDFLEMGYHDISLEMLTRLRDHGVTASFIKSVQQLGYERPSLERAIHLADAGVDEGFFRSMQDLGYKNISLSESIELKNHGVSADFIRGFNELGFKNISLEEATALKDHGVTTEFVMKVKKRTGSDLSLGDYMNLKDQQ